MKSAAEPFHDKFRAPQFQVTSNLNAWIRQREELRKKILMLMGDLPSRPAKINSTVVVSETRPDYRLEKFELENGDGNRIPGYLLLPRTKEPRAPAVLYCHYHGGEYANGKEELFGSKLVPFNPGVVLSRLGCAVMAIDCYGFGERQGQGPGGAGERGRAEERALAKMNLWRGRTLWGMMIRDLQIALDYLCSRPEVDPARIGVTGMSMGSTQAWWLAALDERVKAVVGVACLTRYQDLIESGNINFHGIYFFVPGILKYFDMEAVIALIAPRPLLAMTGESDPGSPPGGVRRINEVAQSVYALYNARGHFRSDLYPGVGHAYTAEMWQETLRWLERWLMTGVLPTSEPRP